jgi:hypothetical protein
MKDAYTLVSKLGLKFYSLVPFGNNFDLVEIISMKDCKEFLILVTNWL